MPATTQKSGAGFSQADEKSSVVFSAPILIRWQSSSDSLAIYHRAYCNQSTVPRRVCSQRSICAASKSLLCIRQLFAQAKKSMYDMYTFGYVYLCAVLTRCALSAQRQNGTPYTLGHASI